MMNNEDLEKCVLDAIQWEPLLKSSAIGVHVSDGVVTLSGRVDSFPKKLEAEKAVKRIVGVKAIVEKIEVTHHESWAKLDDNEIAQAVIKAYKWNWKIPSDKIKVKVEHGWIQLDGEVNWNYQKEAAIDAIQNLDGILGVTNNLVIRSDTADAIEKRIIQQQLQRSWALNTTDIQVEVNGTNVSLIGSVGSLYQKEEAGRIAWNTPGIWSLENKLLVKHTNKGSL